MMEEMESGDSNTLTSLEMTADQALFGGKLDGLVAACYVNERPLQGVAGLLDWRFQGVISYYLRSGAITGRVGECVYLPQKKGDQLFHLFLVGAGITYAPGKRTPMQQESTGALAKNLSTLKIERIGISRSDFGGIPDPLFEGAFKGTKLWITN